jgi:hypothetical protein
MMLASMVMGALAGYPRVAGLGTEVAIQDHEVRVAGQGHRQADVVFDRGDELGHKALCHQVLTPRMDELNGPYVACCRTAGRCFNQDGFKRREYLRAIELDSPVTVPSDWTTLPRALTVMVTRSL